MFDAINVTVVSKQLEGLNTVFTLGIEEEETATLNPTTVHFIQTQHATEKGIAVLPYGGVIFGGYVTAREATYDVTAEIKGVKYISETSLSESSNVGDTFELTKQNDNEEDRPHE